MSHESDVRHENFKSSLSTVQTMSTSLLKASLSSSSRPTSVSSSNDSKNREDLLKARVDSRVVFGDGCVVGPTAYVELKSTCTTDVTAVVNNDFDSNYTTPPTSSPNISVVLVFGPNNIFFEMSKLSVSVNIGLIQSATAATCLLDELELRLHFGDCNQFGIGSFLDVTVSGEIDLNSSPSQSKKRGHDVYLVGSKNVFEARSRISLSIGCDDGDVFCCNDKQQLEMIIGDVNSFGVLTTTVFSPGHLPPPRDGFVFYADSPGKISNEKSETLIQTKFRVLSEPEVECLREELAIFDCGIARRRWEYNEHE